MRKSGNLWNRALSRFGFSAKKNDDRKPNHNKRTLRFEELERRKLLAVLTWTGLGANNNWGTAANWSTGSAPVAGDDLVFSGSTRTATANNLTAGTSFKSIEFKSNNFSISGNNLTLTSGVIVDAGVTGSSIAANLALSGAVTVNVVSSSLTISSTISGAGSLTKSGSGTLILTGTDVYTGGTAIAAGALQLGSGGTTGSIVGNIVDNGQLIVNRSDDLRLSNNLSGTGKLTKSGGGYLTLSGSNAFTGGTTINSGTLSLGGSSSLGYGILTLNGGTLDLNGYDANVTGLSGASATVIGNSADSTTATLNVHEYGNYQGIITDDLGGSMALHFLGGSSGSGNLLLSGVNNYWGGTTIDGGTVTIDGDFVLGYGSVTMNGGIIDMQGHDLSLSQLNGDSSALVTSYWGDATLYIWNGGSYGGRIADGYGGVVSLYAGGGSLTLNNENQYTGGTTIGGGTVKVGTDVSLGYGNLTMSGGSLDLNDHDAFFNNLNGSSSSQITNSAGSSTLNISNGGSFQGVIADGAGTTALSTWGSLTLGGVNTYTGGTGIYGATVTLGSDSALGVGNVTLSGGTINLNDRNLTVRTLTSDYSSVITNSSGSSALSVTVGGTFAGSINDGVGTISLTSSGSLILSGFSSYSGGTTISAGTLQLGTGGRGGGVSGPIVNNGQLVINHDYISFMDSVISGTGSLTKLGSGALYLTAENTYTGGTTVSAGTLSIGAGGTVGSVVGNIVNNASLRFDRSDAVTYAGVISGTGSVTKNGANTLIFTGTNTYTGVTTISAGTLQLGAGGSTGSVAGNIVDNGVLALNRSNSTVFSGVISGSGSVTKLGDNISTLSGANSYAGGTTIAAGALYLGNNAGLGIGSVQIDANGTLNLAGYSPTIHGIYGSGRIYNSSTSKTCSLTSVGDGNFSGIIKKSYSAAKAISLVVASGTLTLSGTTTLTGSTTVAASATLQINNNAFSSSIVANGNLVLANSKSLTLSNSISGTGTLRKTGLGEVVLSGTNTFSGSIYLSVGLTTLGSSTALGTGTVTIENDARLDLGGFNNAAQPISTLNLIDGDVVNGTLAASSSFNLQSGAISANLVGTAGLTKSGSGDVTLTGVNTYLGSTTASGGVLYVGSQALPTGTTVSGSGIVVYMQDLYWNGGNGSWTSSYAWHYSNGVLVSWVDGSNAYFSGGGTITVSGSLNAASMIFASGDYSISGGTLAISSYCDFDSGAGSVIVSSAVSGDGLLKKDGEGELKFSGNSTFTGVAWATNGTLNLDFAAMPTTAPSLWLDGDGKIIGAGSIQFYDSYIYDAVHSRFGDEAISRNEILQILSLVVAQDSVISAAELSDLRAIADNAKLLNMLDYVAVLLSDVANGNAANANYQSASLGNLAAGDISTKLTKLTNKWFLGTDRPIDVNGASTYKLVSGSLIVNGASWRDMRQGMLGDCWLVTGFGSLANASQSCIENMFVDNGDGTYTVRFYYESGGVGSGIFSTDYVTVDCYLPAYDGDPAFEGDGCAVYQGWNSDYAKEVPGNPPVYDNNRYDNPNNELWLALAEKAFAQWCETGHAERTAVNAYASLASGPISSVYTAVTGRAVVYGGNVVTALDNGYAVGIGRFQDGLNYAAYNLSPNHAYAIYGYEYDATVGENVYLLKNPWGYAQPFHIPVSLLPSIASAIVSINPSGTTPAAATLSSASKLTYSDGSTSASSASSSSASASSSATSLSSAIPDSYVSAAMSSEQKSVSTIGSTVDLAAYFASLENVAATQRQSDDVTISSFDSAVTFETSPTTFHSAAVDSDLWASAEDFLPSGDFTPIAASERLMLERKTKIKDEAIDSLFAGFEVEFASL